MSSATLQGNLKVPNDGHIGSVGDDEAITIDSTGNVGIGTTDPANILHIKKDPTVALGAANYASTNGFGQLHIETVTEFNNGSSNLGTSKLKIGIQDGGVNIAPKGYIQSINDDTLGGTLLLNPSSGNVGINHTNPTTPLHILTSSSDCIRINWNDNDWMIYPNDGNAEDGYKLYFLTLPGFDKGGYISGEAGGVNSPINFTGQHRNMLNTNINDSSRGLIVSSTGNYLNLDNSLGPSINESLPICVITNTDNDKKVFGVISDKEDTNTSREYSTGNFVSVDPKTNTNEERMYINSVGEGSIWVCNKNGDTNNKNIENGDYITSTTVPGYGGKQIMIEGALMNFTVAKITCDCDFSLTKIVKQKLKVTETTTDGETTQTIDYDSSGNVQYVDDLDSEGNQQMVYKYETRFLQEDGTLLVDEADYNTRLANGESVYIACFVGCTYHCG